MKSHKTTQKERVLFALKACRRQWIPMPDLVRCIRSCSLNQRIMDLRKDGLWILNKKEYVNGKVKSSYKLM